MHAVLLIGVRIVAPDALHFHDIISNIALLNSAEGRRPLHAEIEAQVNHEGGGDADDGHKTSPLPDMQRNDEGDALKVANRRVEELEELQRQLSTKAKTAMSVDPQTDTNLIHPPQPNGTDDYDSKKVLAKSAAEIEREVSDYEKRPRRAQITPSTKRTEYAQFYSKVLARIEKIGTLNFPQRDGKKLYGELVVYVPIYKDGSIYTEGGGPHIEHSSGDDTIDKTALRIVKKSAPFKDFPLLSGSGRAAEVLELVYRFKFTREEGLAVEKMAGDGK